MVSPRADDRKSSTSLHGALRRKEAVYIRFGSLADICSAKAHVRFTLNSGLMQRSKNDRYSITSSARERSVGGTTRPIECAVRRFIASLISVGSSNGSSAILAPFKIRENHGASCQKERVMATSEISVTKIVSSREENKTKRPSSR
jgi:hypothetical protein